MTSTAAPLLPADIAADVRSTATRRRGCKLHMATVEARLGLSDDDFSGLSSGCEDDFSGDDQSVDNFNGGGTAVAGAQPELAVVDIVHDEPSGREQHRWPGFSPVVGAVQEICAELYMLHVRGADGMDMDIGLAPIGKGDRGTHDSFEGRHNHTCSTVLALASYTTRGSSLTHAARLSAPVRARGRGGRV